MSIKYRLKEVAADFGMTTKEVSAVMEKFFEKISRRDDGREGWCSNSGLLGR